MDLMPLVSLLLSAGLLHFRELCCQKGATAPLDPASFYYLLFNIYRQTINLCEYKRVYIVYLLAGSTAAKIAVTHLDLCGGA